MSQLFPKAKSVRRNVKVELDLYNYATTADLKKATGVHTSNFTKKAGLASCNWDTDKLDTDKLKTVPVDWGYLSNVVNNDVVKKTDIIN